MSFLAIAAVLGVVAVLASVAGEALFGLTGAARGWPRSLRVAIAFALGIAMLLDFWRLAAVLLPARAALASALAAELALIAWSAKRGALVDLRDHLKALREHWRASPAFRGGALAWLLVAPVLHAFWMDRFVAMPRNPFGDWGSLHSGRYHNIALYVMQHDIIPTIGQNYGQSLLAAIPGMVAPLGPMAALALWLQAFALATFLALVGVFRLLGASRRRALVSAGALMVTGGALSMTPIVVVDSGTPLLLNGYSDGFLSVVSFIAVAILISDWIVRPRDRRQGQVIIVAVFALVWTMSCVQNTVLAGVALGAVWVGAATRAERRALVAPLLRAAGALVLATALGAPLGGMLCPSRFLTPEARALPGLMSVPQAGVKLSPFLPYYLFPSWIYGGKLLAAPPEATIAAFLGPGAGAERLVQLEELEHGLLLGVRAIFWPLVGVLAIAIARRRSARVPAERVLGVIAVATLAAGIGIAYPFAIGDRKWELSRFLLVGHTFGLVGLYLALPSWLTRLPRRRQIGACVALAILLGSGTAFQVLTRLNQHRVDGRTLHDWVDEIPRLGRFTEIVGD